MPTNAVVRWQLRNNIIPLWRCIMIIECGCSLFQLKSVPVSGECWVYKHSCFLCLCCLCRCWELSIAFHKLAPFNSLKERTQLSMKWLETFLKSEKNVLCMYMYSLPSCKSFSSCTCTSLLLCALIDDICCIL